MVCEACDERMIFAMVDSHDKQFDIGLTTILQCLNYAIEHGVLPKLPSTWVRNIHSSFTNIDFSINTVYNDSCIVCKDKKVCEYCDR